MKLSLIHYIAASAALVSVGASPLRVVVVGNIDAAPNSSNVDDNANVAHIVAPAQEAENDNTVVPAVQQSHRKRPCGKGQTKAVSISNTFRGALGLPLIETTEMKEGSVHGGLVHITPFLGGPSEFIEFKGKHMPPPPPFDGPRPFHRMHHHKFHHQHHRSSFLQRIHIALLSLGPWEGRAVAFVLGCGLGVLLRMFWVFSVIIFRTIRGHNEEEEEYAHIIYEIEADAEEIAVPPPNYTYPAEKVEEQK